MKDAYIAALNAEREQQAGNAERVKAIDEELRRVGAVRAQSVKPDEAPKPVKRATKRAKA